MTVIAIKKYDNEIVISADQQWTAYREFKEIGDTKNKIYTESNKIFKVNGIIVGGTGHVQDVSLFNIFIKSHKPKTATEDDIVEFMIEFGEWAKKKDSTFNLSDNNYIMVIEKLAFLIFGGLLVKEINEYAAVGSGMYLALGALYYDRSPQEAVKVAKEFDLYCGGKTQTIKIPIK